MSTDTNLPATTDTSLVEAGAGPEPATATTAAPRQPMSVAYLPLALATFVIIAFVMAAWTFLAAAQ